MTKKKGRTWVDDCVDYWSQRVCDEDIGCDWEVASVFCWRCGTKSRHQKCHIIPRAFGGSDGVQNIIPLCATCHDEAPDVADADEMWRWIKEDHASIYGDGSFWIAKAFRESGVDFSWANSDDIEPFMEVFRAFMRKMSCHCGQNTPGVRFKNSSRVWVFRKSVEMYLEVKSGRVSLQEVVSEGQVQDDQHVP